MSKKEFILKLFKSAGALLTADSAGLILSVVFSIILGRLYGKEFFGVYSLSFVMATMLRTITESGYDLRIPRETAENHENVYNLIEEAQLVKNSIWLISFVPFAVFGYLSIGGFDYIILLIYVIPLSMGSTYKSVLRGLGRMGIIAKIDAGLNMMMYAILITLLYFGKPEMFSIFIFFPCIEILKSIMFWNYLEKSTGISIPLYIRNWRFALSTASLIKIRKSFKSQLPLISVNFLSVWQFRSAMLAVGWAGTKSILGEYSAAQRFITFLRIIPGAILNTLLPEFSSGKQGEGDFRLLLSVLISLLIGLAVSLILTLLAEPFMMLTFRFESAIPVLRILSWSFIPVMISLTLESYLLANKRENSIIPSMIISSSLILISALIIVPVYGATGAAFVYTGGEFILMLLYAVFTAKIKPRQQNR